MSGAYPLVPLGEILRESKEWVTLQPETCYKQVTVRLWGKGVALRTELTGSEIAASRQVVVHTDQFILSRIDARNGAFGLIPPELDGAVVSNDFPIYTPDPSRVLPAYLGWLSRTHRFVEICRLASEGTTNRKRLQEDRFLAMCIPLPALEEQRRIVGRIEEVAGKIEAARGLRREAVLEALDLMPAAVDTALNQLHSKGYRTARVGDVELLVTSGPRNFASRYTASGLRFYRAQDIDTAGRISDENLVYIEMPEGMTTRAIVQPGDVLVVITGATIGRSALVQEQHPMGLVSQHVGLVRVDKAHVDPTFLHYALQSSAWAGGQLDDLKYGQGKPGLNLANLRSLAFPMPPLSDQRRVVNYLDGVRAKVDAVKRLQEQTAAELDALLPAVLERAFSGGL